MKTFWGIPSLDEQDTVCTKLSCFYVKVFDSKKNNIFSVLVPLIFNASIIICLLRVVK